MDNAGAETEMKTLTIRALWICVFAAFVYVAYLIVRPLLP